MDRHLVSICIPTYKRPKELLRALKSIDTKYVEDINIIISENCSTLQKDTRDVVQMFIEQSKYKVMYYEQVENVGYDRNIQTIVKYADGDYIIFLSDDDVFVSGALDNYIDFIRAHQQCGYILRSYRNVYMDGRIQDFKYFKNDCEFSAGDSNYINMFDKSIFLSGFTIRTDAARKFYTDKLDGSLLYQLYLLAEVCRIMPSAYCCTIITQSFEGGTPFFGDSKVERNLYKAGANPIENSLNFMRWYNVVIDLIANKYNNDTNKIIRHNMSKLSYGFLKSQRRSGIKVFNQYAKELKNMGFASSILFYIYYISLLILGEHNCDKLIALIKKFIGYRPRF